jgi:selenocysteine-specific elongation factor
MGQDGGAVIDGAFVRRPGHHLQLTPRDQALWTKTAPLLSGDDRFRPPRVREIAASIGAPETEVRRLLKWLGRADQVREVAPDHFFLRDALAEMVGIAADIASGAQDGHFTAAQFRDRLDNGRKVAIQLLEYFDRSGVTARRGDLRRINPQRRNAFGTATGASATQRRVG